jgi:hypothetical protein
MRFEVWQRRRIGIGPARSRPEGRCGLLVALGAAAYELDVTQNGVSGVTLERTADAPSGK